MILSGIEIEEGIRRGDIVIEPFDPVRVNPNSYNLRLANEIIVYKDDVLDMKKCNKHERIIIPESGLRLEPGTLYLGRTVEFTKTERFVPMLEGRSSIGRLGLYIHVTAGFGDVGFAGYWTLELSCVQPVIIYPYVEVCQIFYHTISGNHRKYNSGKYQDNKGIQPSLLHQELKSNGEQLETGE